MNKQVFIPIEIENLDYNKFENVFMDFINYEDFLKIGIINKFYKVNIIFNRFVSFRVINESNLMKYWETLDEKKINGYVFYKISNSEYLSTLKMLSYNFLRPEDSINDFEHYGIFTLSDCVEIISEIPPDIEIIELTK